LKPKIAESDQHFTIREMICASRRLKGIQGAHMKRFTTIAMLIATAMAAQAEPRDRDRRHHNYIIERQQAGVVQGPPTDRLINRQEAN
jgi:hypothetical protein